MITYKLEGNIRNVLIFLNGARRRISSASPGTRVDIEVLKAVKIDTGRESEQKDMDKLTLFIK